MLPKVIVYNAVSLDGRTTGFNADSELYYELASKLNVDAVLMGSETVLTGFEAQPFQGFNENGVDFKPRKVDPADERPLLAVPDSRGQIRIWSRVLEMPYIRDVLVLCSRSTPQEYLDFLDEHYIKYMIIGYQKVDLGFALEELNTQFGVKSVRVDSGGVLNGVLLRENLVDEIHVLIHPELVGGTSPSSIYQAPDLESDEVTIPVFLMDIEKLEDDKVLLRYRIFK
jgi:2,5-diamino-6-(ribosylamino)-4(3H)-pyrimidinone 5'-phosphate reductase